MIRAISTVLVVAIALQTVGCSTWKPLVRASEVDENDGQSALGEQMHWNLTKGTRVRVRIREGSPAPIKGRVIECVVVKVDLTSLTITPVAFFDRNNAGRDITLRYSDIESIEYRKRNNWEIFALGIGVGGVLAFFLILWSLLRGFELD